MCLRGLFLLYVELIYSKYKIPALRPDTKNTVKYI